MVTAAGRRASNHDALSMCATRMCLAKVTSCACVCGAPSTAVSAGTHALSRPRTPNFAHFPSSAVRHTVLAAPRICTLTLCKVSGGRPRPTSTVSGAMGGCVAAVAVHQRDAICIHSAPAGRVSIPCVTPVCSIGTAAHVPACALAARRSISGCYAGPTSAAVVRLARICSTPGQEIVST